MGMRTSEYLDRLLISYAATFDVHADFELGGHKYSAFCQYYSEGDRYVLVKSAKLWTVKEHEYVLFSERDRMTESDIEQARDAMENYLEPVYVRKGAKYPEQDHMSSWLTAVFISEKAPDPEVKHMIRKFSFVRNYLFTVRGRAEGRLICVDLENEEICANDASKEVLKLYETVFDDVRQGKSGFKKAVEQGRAKVLTDNPEGKY